MREIGQHQAAERSYMDEGVTLLTLAKDAQRLFEKRPAADKRRLLNFVLSNSYWSNGELKATFRQPFNLIAEITSDGPDDDGGGGPNLPARSELQRRALFLTEYDGSTLRDSLGLPRPAG